MAISTNPKPTIYRNLYENTGHGWPNVDDGHILGLHFTPSASAHVTQTAKYVMLMYKCKYTAVQRGHTLMSSIWLVV